MHVGFSKVASLVTCGLVSGVACLYQKPRVDDDEGVQVAIQSASTTLNSVYITDGPKWQPTVLTSLPCLQLEQLF